MRGIAELEFLPRDDADKLEAAYRFFRRVEHRLQIEARTADAHRARAGTGAATARAAVSVLRNEEEFLAALSRAEMQSVRAIFQRVVQEPTRLTSRKRVR